MMDNRILTEIQHAKRLMIYQLGANPTYKEELLEEGWKDWTLGLSLLITSIVNGGKVEAQIQNVPDAKIDSTITAINQMIQNKDKLQQIANYLKQKGYGNQTNSIIAHGKNVITQIERKRKSKGFNITTKNTSDPKEMLQLLRSGKSALTSANITTVIDTLYPETNRLFVENINMTGDAEDFFDFGKLTLKNEIKRDVKALIDSIVNSGYIITRVTILSGTDAVRINPVGDLKRIGINNNADLATARANVIKDYITSLGIDSSLMQVCTYPHNVENLPGFQPDKSLRIAGIQIEALNPLTTTQITSEPETNRTTKIDFQLVGISGDQTPDKFGVYKSKSKVKITKKKKIQHKKNVGKAISCPTWNKGDASFWFD